MYKYTERERGEGEREVRGKERREGEVGERGRDRVNRATFPKRKTDNDRCKYNKYT